jgi:hypothetical protein
MARILPILWLTLSLAACGQPSPSNTPASGTEAGDVLPEPQSQAAPRYVGRWAAASLGCDYPAWRFEADRLSTQGEVSCRFERVDAVAGGYEVTAQCVAEGPPEPHRITLAFPESPKAMVLSGGPFAGPIGLVYCGP